MAAISRVHGRCAPDVPQQRELGQGGAEGADRLLPPGIAELEQLLPRQKRVKDGLVQPWRDLG